MKPSPAFRELFQLDLSCTMSAFRPEGKMLRMHKGRVQIADENDAHLNWERPLPSPNSVVEDMSAGLLVRHVPQKCDVYYQVARAKHQQESLALAQAPRKRVSVSINISCSAHEARAQFRPRHSSETVYNMCCPKSVSCSRSDAGQCSQGITRLVCIAKGNKWCPRMSRGLPAKQ